MAEREVNTFRNYKPPVRDHTEEVNEVVQSIEEINPKAQERIKKAERGELKARLASILDRGVVQDRLHVDLPSHLHGEWVRNDPLEVNRLKLLGFKVDTEYAAKRAIHSDGTDSAVVGDVVYMVCDREYKNIIDEIRHEQMLEAHRKQKIKGRDVNREEREFITNVDSESDDEGTTVIPYSNSSEKTVTRGNLADAIKKVDSQVEKSNL